MQHIKRTVFTAVFSVIILSLATNSLAQMSDARVSFSPYSIHGIGTVLMQGTAMNKAMGGIGIGIRDNRHINYLNPASASARDTLAFMMDFGVSQNNYLFNADNVVSANNTFTISHLLFTFPIYKKSAIIIGLVPYSSVNYSFEREEIDPLLVSKYGDIRYKIYGNGGIYKAFLGASADIFKGFSIGIQGDFYFGAFERFSNIVFDAKSGNKNVITGQKSVVRSFSGKVGLQYSHRLGKESVLTAGATYSLKTPLKGRFSDYAYAVSEPVVDTVYQTDKRSSDINIPAELSVGISYRQNDKLLAGFDFTRQDWKSAGFKKTVGVDISSTISNTFRFGMEYTPDRYDVRYYLNRVTYRAGAYYQATNLVVNGYGVNAFGVTFGVELPMYRWYNSIGLSIDLGQRGSLKNNLVRERYLMINASINIHEMWFMKLLYN